MEPELLSDTECFVTQDKCLLPVHYFTLGSFYTVHVFFTVKIAPDIVR